MSKKTELVAKLLSKIEPRWPLPTPVEGASLLEQGLVAVLQRRLDPKAVGRVVESLRATYADWNELRVAQSREIADAIAIGSAGIAVAGDVRAYLQEVFQRSHGLELQFLGDDAEATKRFAATLPFIGTGLLHYLMWLATPGEFPITAGLMRVLDRVGVAPRVSNIKKARAVLAPLVGKERRLEMVFKVGEVASRWCAASKPLCHECVIVDDCRFGRKAFREWRQQQERMEVQRVREEARLAVLRRKEEVKRRREEERARKLAEAVARKRALEEERRARIEGRKKAAEEARLAEQRRREEIKRGREAERARKQAEIEAVRKARRLEAERKAKLAAKQAAARKAAAQKAAARKVEARKAQAQKAAAKKAAARKAPTRKPGKPGPKVPTQGGRKPAAEPRTRKPIPGKGAGGRPERKVGTSKGKVPQATR